MFSGPIVLVIAIGLACYMGWNIGANDVANAMGTSVGSGALTFKRAVIAAAILEFAGAVLVGGRVTDTVRKGIIDPGWFVSQPDTFVLGMICALAAASIWLNLATYKGWPVSTTHSIVGAVIGFGIIATGASSINWRQTGLVVLSWGVSPVCGGVIAAVLFLVIRRTVFTADKPLQGLYRVCPFMVALLGLILTLSMIFKGLKSLRLELTFLHASLCGLLVGVLAGLLTYVLLRRYVRTHQQGSRRLQFQVAERAFGYLQIVTACYVAFAHGANDVANAVGPLAAVVAVSERGLQELSVAVPLWILLLGGFAIVVGLLTYGYKVMQTIGEKITDITPSRGFSAEFGAATTILVGSKLGLPLSTTHTLVGAVIGVGMVHGLAALDLRVIRGIASSWVITVPFTALVAAALYAISSAILL